MAVRLGTGKSVKITNKTPAKPVAKPTTAVAKKAVQAAKPPVVPAATRTPPKPAVNPKLKPGAPGGPPKSAGQLAFEAKEREDKRLGRGRFSPLAPYLPRAQESVKAQDTPALGILARQVAELQSRGQRDIADTTARGQRERGNLEEIYGRLSEFQGRLGDQSKADTRAISNRGGAAYDALAASINKGFGETQAVTSAETARMGLTDAAPTLNRQSQADQQYLTGRTGADKAAFQSGMEMQGQGFQNIIAMMRGNAGTENYSRQAVSEREQAKTIADLMFEMENGTRDLSGRQADIVSTQGSRAYDLATALEDKQYGRTQEAAQNAINNRLAEANYQLAVSGQTHQQRMDQASLRLRQAEAAAASAAAAGGPSELEIIEVAKARAELDNIVAMGKVGVGTGYDQITGRAPVVRGTANGVVSRGGRTR